MAGMETLNLREEFIVINSVKSSIEASNQYLLNSSNFTAIHQQVVVKLTMLRF